MVQGARLGVCLVFVLVRHRLAMGAHIDRGLDQCPIVSLELADRQAVALRERSDALFKFLWIFAALEEMDVCKEQRLERMRPWRVSVPLLVLRFGRHQLVVLFKWHRLRTFKFHVELRTQRHRLVTEELSSALELLAHSGDRCRHRIALGECLLEVSVLPEHVIDDTLDQLPEYVVPIPCTDHCELRVMGAYVMDR